MSGSGWTCTVREFGECLRTPEVVSDTGGRGLTGDGGKGIKSVQSLHGPHLMLTALLMRRQRVQNFSFSGGLTVIVCIKPAGNILSWFQNRPKNNHICALQFFPLGIQHPEQVSKGPDNLNHCLFLLSC